MTGEPDENGGDGGEGDDGVERSPSGRKKRSDAGRPRGSGGGRKHVSTRFQRRAEKVEETIRELVRIGKPDLDVEGLSFSEVVNRDVKAWGNFVAQIAEWLPPLGTAIDVAFGSAFVTVLNMLPSFRAARRDLAERRERRQAEQAKREEELPEPRPTGEPPPARGVFDSAPLGVVEQESAPTMTREEWLASGGNGGA